MDISIVAYAIRPVVRTILERSTQLVDHVEHTTVNDKALSALNQSRS